MLRALFVLLAACGPSLRSPPAGEPDAPAPIADAPIVPIIDAPGCQAIDVLFVIDNSGSMDQEQANLVANFPAFISVLDASALDYRVAVTTTGRNYSWTMSTPLGPIPQSQDGGDDGKLRQPAACNMTRRWIEKADAGVAGTFSCLANVGTDGPSEEMPLGAIRDAFEDRIADGTNTGFHRPDALLALVILTDENDCSLEHAATVPFAGNLCDQADSVADYVHFLDTFTGDHSRWATAVIAGPGPSSCSSSFGDAEAATRLVDFVGQVGTNATLSSICDGDLSIGLAHALSLFQSACGNIIL